MSRIEQIGNATLYLGDCTEILPTLGRFDAVIADPPYGRVKGDFDHIWTNRASMLKDARQWLAVVDKAMKPNATLWWFAWPSLAGRIEAMISEKLNPLAHVVWQKPFSTGEKFKKESLRAPVSTTERILMFEHYGADSIALGESGYQAKCDELRGFVFEPLRAYLADEWKRAGLTVKDAGAATGSQHMPRHWFSKSQWVLPTEENYKRLQDRANGVAKGEYLRREYEYLRREYEYLRREYEYLRREYEYLRREYEYLRRWFDCRNGDQFSDVWTFSPPAERHGHPTEKPIELMAYLVRLSVRPGGVCVAPFLGSGATGVACAQLGRHFVGIERDPKYFDIACRRIEQAYKQGVLIPHDAPARPSQGEMFDYG